MIDPCCGSGGMFVQSMKFVESHNGSKKDVSVYGQEGTTTTFKLAKMNLAIRGISADLGAKADDTFFNDQHKDLKADFIMANPPFNQNSWRKENELVKDSRWLGYEVPPTGNANYGWILHILSKLSQNGVAGFLLANGSQTGDGTEYLIRKQLVENNLVEAIIVLPRNLFYTTDISVTLWILNKNKKARIVEHNGIIRKYRDRNEILFMDLRTMGIPYEKKYTQLSDEEIQKIANTYHTWQQSLDEYKDVPEYCYSASKEDVVANDYALSPSRYIEFVNKDENVNYEEKMQELQTVFTQLIKDDREAQANLLAIFKDLGYEIKL